MFMSLNFVEYQFPLYCTHESLTWEFLHKISNSDFIGDGNKPIHSLNTHVQQCLFISSQAILWCLKHKYKQGMALKFKKLTAIKQSD